MTKRLVRKDPATGKPIQFQKACRLMKSCEQCDDLLPKCVEWYDGRDREKKALAPARIEFIQELDRKGWAIYGICELIGVDERYVKLALERTPEFIEKLKIARR